MEAIDTYYGDYYFRSRLEARWAYFLDQCSITYLYEYEGYKEFNKMYLPDFYLPETYFRGSNGLYIEIKNPVYVYDQKYNWFKKPLVLFSGYPQRNIYRNSQRVNYTGGYEIYPYQDDYQVIWICKSCKSSKVTHEALSLDKCEKCGGRCDYELLEESAINSTRKRF